MRLVSRKNQWSNNSREFIAREDGEIVGHVTLLRLDSDEVEVQDVWVDSRFRQQGVATRLMQKAITFCPSKPMCLLVSRGKDNIPAVTLYKKFGFKFVPRCYNEMKRKPETTEKV